jgi:hypothetical protein
MGLTVREYLRSAGDQTIPPMVLELTLRSGKSFYIKNILPVEDDTDLVPLRVWDLRALSKADLDTVLRRLNTAESRGELDSIERLHPKLDQGNLWVLISEIEAIMEWHDRLWPAVEDRVTRQVSIGAER